MNLGLDQEPEADQPFETLPRQAPKPVAPPPRPATRKVAHDPERNGDEPPTPAAPGPAHQFVGGRGLPHSIEAEEYLLSCCLIDGAEVVGRCLTSRITPASFFLPAHGLVFEVLKSL